MKDNGIIEIFEVRLVIKGFKKVWNILIHVHLCQ
jgi:hypothetical protein